MTTTGGAVRAWVAAHQRPAAFVVGLAVVVVAASATAVVAGSVRSPDVLVGRTSDPAVSSPAPAVAAAGATGRLTPEPAADDGPGGTGRGGTRQEPANRAGLLDADGRPYGSAVLFDSTIPVPTELRWILIVGTDARAGEDPLRTRADSIHLVATNPTSHQATVLGFPRDSWVDIPGHGKDKINSATVLGGPDLLARTIHAFTGLPIQYWVVTGFQGFQDVVDAVGGVDVRVERRMDDRYSGAHFQPGFHHFNGFQALAYSRDRHDQPDGDFSRSANQATLMVAALAKIRAEVSDEQGLMRWVGFAIRHLEVRNVPSSEMLGLLALARSIPPEDVKTLVAEGTAGTAGSQSVVYLDAKRLAAVADDLRPDAVLGAPRVPTSASPTTDATTTTTPPAASPTTTSIRVGPTTTTTATSATTTSTSKPH